MSFHSSFCYRFDTDNSVLKNVKGETSFCKYSAVLFLNASSVHFITGPKLAQPVNGNTKFVGNYPVSNLCLIFYILPKGFLKTLCLNVSSSGEVNVVFHTSHSCINEVDDVITRNTSVII